MSSYKGSIDLLQLSKVGVATIKGVGCVVIPILENDLAVYDRSKDGKKSSLYLNVVAWENKNGISDKGSSHGIKQDFSKEYRDLRAEDVKNSPFLGNLAPFGVKTPAEQASGLTTEEKVSEADVENVDDLPF